MLSMGCTFILGPLLFVHEGSAGGGGPLREIDYVIFYTSSHIRNKPSKVDCWWRRLLPAHYGFLIHCLGGLTWGKNPSLYNRLNHDLDGQVRRLYVMRADEENPMARLHLDMRAES